MCLLAESTVQVPPVEGSFSEVCWLVPSQRLTVPAKFPFFPGMSKSTGEAVPGKVIGFATGFGGGGEGKSMTRFCGFEANPPRTRT